ncbi:hypothetical protein [Sphingomonas sp. ID0503]|uniref:hypothetical protein n=1 Tax=Sphingomonas sp. ID0503 TaxID=3399691 RepID=UPI003AFB687B
MSLTWKTIETFAAALPGAERATYYGGPAVKANAHAIVTPGREDGSFCLHIDRETVDLLKETDPATFWQSPHYEGWPAVLVRYDSPDPERVFATVERAHAQAMARKRKR